MVSSKTDQPAVLEYQDGIARRSEQETVFDRIARLTSWACALVVACAFAFGFVWAPGRNEIPIAITFFASIVYLVARIVHDKRSRTARVQMLASGLPALVLGLVLLTPIFHDALQFGFRYARYWFRDPGLLPVVIEMMLLAWFAIVWMYGPRRRDD